MILRNIFNGNLVNFNHKLKYIAKHEGKSIFFLYYKFLKCYFLIGCGYSDYLNYELYKKNKQEILEYVTIATQDKFYEIVSPSAYKTFFTIKPNFLKNFAKYIQRDYITKESTLAQLKAFLKNNEYFIQKPIDGLGGSGVIKVYAKEIKNINKYYQKIISENLLLEEFVKQHSKISAICDSCVNTIRVVSFVNKGQARIIFACMRFGNGESNIDNFHQGGMAVLVNFEEGVLVGNAYDKNLNEYICHPKSGVKFDGFKIPNWESAKKTVLEAALVNQKIQVVGWDVAITQKGVTFIEGNRRPGFDLVQVLNKKGMKSLMSEIIAEINETSDAKYQI